MVRLLFVLTSLLLVLSGCDRQADRQQEPQIATEPNSALDEIDPEQAASSRFAWQLGETLLNEASADCAAMHLSLEQFLAQPAEEPLARVRADWRACHNQWHQFDLFMSLKEINPGLFGGLDTLGFAIDAYPLQPGYLDSLEAYPYSGIVNDISLAITADNLRAQHGLTNSEDVSLGLHALEFLLWGEKGERPASDYDDELVDTDPDTQLKPAEQPVSRRRELLLLVSHLLQDDLERLSQAWLPGEMGFGESSFGENNFGESSFGGNYEQLRPASRIQMLKSAGHHLLEHQLPQQVRQLSEPDMRHNRFAGQNLAPVAKALKGLSRIYFTGEPALAQWLGEADQIEAWHNRLESLSGQLESGAQEPLDPGPQSPEQLIKSLQELAQPLAATASLDRPPAPGSDQP